MAPTNPREEFPHKGKITIEGITANWREKPGGEIEFSTGSGNYVKLSKFITYISRAVPKTTKRQQRSNVEEVAKSRDELELAIINPLLAHYRPHAVTDKNGYYAASAVVSISGKLFIDVNNEHVIADPFAGRGCSETSAYGKYLKGANKGEEEIERGANIAKVYLTSGVMYRNGAGELRDKIPGHVSCFCGECRQNLRLPAKGGKFIFVPTNDGSVNLSLNSEAKNPRELNPNEAWELDYGSMYPLPEYIPLDEEKSRHVHQGALAILESHPVPRIQTTLPKNLKDLDEDTYAKIKQTMETVGTSIPGLALDSSLENINKALLHLIEQAYDFHKNEAGERRNLEITAVILKTNESDMHPSQFYPAVLVNGKNWLPSKPPAMPVALENAFNRIGISEVYIMTFDRTQLQEEMDATLGDRGSSPQHQLKMPDPAALGRLIKNMKSSDETKLMVVPLNNGSLGKKQLEDLIGHPLDIMESFGPGYAHPKKILQEVGRS